jgi:hypothetical protein
MKESIVKVKLGYGEPPIKRAELCDGVFYFELILTSIPEDGVQLISTDRELSIEIIKADCNCNKFKVTLLSNELAFNDFVCFRISTDMVMCREALRIEIPVLQPEMVRTQETETIII